MYRRPVVCVILLRSEFIQVWVIRRSLYGCSRVLWCTYFMSMFVIAVWPHALLLGACWSVCPRLFVIYYFGIVCYMLHFVQIILQILIICLNICLSSNQSYCLALCCNFPADCSYKGHADSGSDPSRAVVKISCASSRSSNLIPFSSGGLRDTRVHQIATTCFSISPQDINLLVSNFIICILVK